MIFAAISAVFVAPFVAEHFCMDLLTPGQMNILSSYYIENLLSRHTQSPVENEMHRRFIRRCRRPEMKLGEVLNFVAMLCDNLEFFTDNYDKEYVRQEIETYSSINSLEPKEDPGDCHTKIITTDCLQLLYVKFDRYNFKRYAIEGYSNFVCNTPWSRQTQVGDSEDEKEVRKRWNDSKDERGRKMQIFWDKYLAIDGKKFTNISTIFNKAVIHLTMLNEENIFYRPEACRLHGMIGYYDGELSIIKPCEAFGTMQLADRFLRANYKIKSRSDMPIDTLRIVGAKLIRAPIIISSKNYYLHRDLKTLDLSMNAIEEFHFLLNLPNLRNVSLGKQFSLRGRVQAPLRILFDMKSRIKRLEIPGLKIDTSELYMFLEKNSTLELLTIDCTVLKDKRIIEEICFGSTKHIELFCYDPDLENGIVNVRNTQNPCPNLLDSITDTLAQMKDLFILMLFITFIVILIRFVMSRIGRDKLAYPMNEMEFELKKRLQVAGFSDKGVNEIADEYHGFGDIHIAREIVLAKELAAKLTNVIRSNETELKQFTDDEIMAYTLGEQALLNSELLRKKCCNIIPCPCWH